MAGAEVVIFDTGVTVSPTNSDVTVEVPSVVVTTRAPGVRTRIPGSSFDSGNSDGNGSTTSDGATERSYTHSSRISDNALVVISKNVLDPDTEYSLSTVTTTDDTITITGRLYEDEVVLLWD